MKSKRITINGNGGKQLNTELKQFLDTNLQKDTDLNTISVFPIPCGVGKSEYIKYLLADALQNNYGLIIVTDSVNRLNDYVSDGQNDNLIEYIQRNLHRLSILTGETISEEIKTLNYKPIVLMTTQRYFDLSRDEIINFTSNQKYKRSKIVFDEKIYLLESKKLTVKSLNDISTALKEGLDNTVNPIDKEWLIEQYDTFNAKLQQRLNDNERENNNTNSFRREVYFDAGGLKLSEDDSRFYALIESKENNRKLRKYDAEALKNLKAIGKLVMNGAITSQKIKSKKSNQEYKNYFTVVTNNIDKLIDIGAKVFVLDGTADISPEYRLKYVKIINCSQFNRDLSKLTINIVNVNTSKDKLTRKSDKTKEYIKTIINYITAQPLNINTVFTYQSIENKFKGKFDNIEHFGNIKGSNKYRDINNICQVGLNRWSELIYTLYANEIGICNDSDESIVKRIYDKETIDNIRCRLILSDIEQNLYRCKIRNNDNTENCTYTLICSTSEKTEIFENYQPLINMIKSRYEPHGAIVNVIDTPIEFKLLKANERQSKNTTGIQKFCIWLKKQPSGRLFKRSDLKNEIALTDSQFKELKKAGILNRLRTQKQGVYQIKNT